MVWLTEASEGFGSFSESPLETLFAWKSLPQMENLASGNGIRLSGAIPRENSDCSVIEVSVDTSCTLIFPCNGALSSTFQTERRACQQELSFHSIHFHKAITNNCSPHAPWQKVLHIFLRMNIRFITLCVLILCNFVLSDVILGLNTCMRKIIRRYFRWESVRVYVMTEICVTRHLNASAIPLEESSCFDFSLFHSASKTSIEVATDYMDWKDRVQNIILFATGETELGDVITGMRTVSGPESKVLVVLFGENGTTTDLVRNIIGKIWERARLMNVVVMDGNDGEDLVLYSWYPYAKGNCENLESVRVIEKCSKAGFEKGHNLFRKRKIFSGLNDCPIPASAMHSFFFTNIAAVPDRFSDGMDFRIVREVTRKYGLNVTYVVPTSLGDHFNRTDENGSLAGSMRKLFEYKIDFAFSGLQIVPEVVDYVEYSAVYFIDKHQWWVPKAGYKDQWGTILNIFPATVWTGILLSLLFFSVFSYFLYNTGKKSRKHTSFYDLLFTAFSLTMGQSIKNVYSAFKFRFLLVCYTVFSMNVTLFFQSLLFTILTSPSYYNPYVSLEACFNLGLTVYLFPLEVQLFKNDSLGEKILNSNQFRLAYDPLRTVKDLVSNQSAMMILGNARIQYILSQYYHDQYGKPLAQTIPGVITISMLAFHFAPNSPLVILFDEVILHLLQGGFIQKWKMDLHAPRGIVYGKAARALPLTMHNLRSIFQFYVMSTGICVAVFVCELLVARKKRFDTRKR